MASKVLWISAVDGICEAVGISHAHAPETYKDGPQLLCGRSSGGLNWTGSFTPATEPCADCLAKAEQREMYTKLALTTKKQSKGCDGRFQAAVANLKGVRR